MSKIIVIPSSIKQISILCPKVDGFVVGIKDLSINLPTYFTLEDVKQICDICKKENKELFVSLNKNVHNLEIDYLKEIMIQLNNINITAVIYYDIAIVNIKEELKLNYDLVWGQEHLATNYSTINYWQDMGAKYSFLSSEITLDEILDIRKNTNAKLIVPVFGYLPMFTSKRPLVKNYLKYFSLKDNSEINYIEKEDKIYPIVNEKNGTTIYSSYILNALDEIILLKENNIDYFLVNTFNIDLDKILKLLEAIIKINQNNSDKIINSINTVFLNQWDKGFLYKETIYKVKNNE